MKRNGHARQHPSRIPQHWQEERDWAYSEKVYPVLARRYPNQWVAIAHHRVIASGTHVMKVLAQARRKVQWEEIPLVFVERGIHVYPLHGH